MRKENKKIRIDKKPIIIIGVILMVVLVVLIVPSVAHAGLGESIARAIFRFFANVMFSICGFFVSLAGKFFEAMLDMGFKKQVEVAKIGWTIIRDFSNMLFVLFMVIIAFGTILRIERYGAKQLLPKLIIIALLINFSMVICYVIIDFSNITADYFIQGAKKVANSNDLKGGIGGALTEGMNLGKILTPSSCDDYKGLIEECSNPEVNAELTAEEKQKCVEDLQASQKKCVEDKAALKAASDDQKLMDIIASAILGSIVMLIAAFTLMAGGILLIVRIVVIWFLVMVSPFVFICYLLPALKTNWDKWWKNLLSWCFFAPAYAFFIWLAVQIAKKYKETYIKSLTKATASGGSNTTITGFFTTGDTIFYFAFMIAILLGGLIAAKSFGLYGANTAMTLGKAAANKISGYSKAKNYFGARKKVREEEKKEAVGRRLRLREVATVRQAVKERLPGEFGRRARAKKAQTLNAEAQRMAKNYTLKDIRKVAGNRGLTKNKRSSRLAAAMVLSSPNWEKNRRNAELENLTDAYSGASGKKQTRVLRKFDKNNQKLDKIKQKKLPKLKKKLSKYPIQPIGKIKDKDKDKDE